MRRTSVSSLIWGLVLIVVGVGFLLDTTGVIQFGDFIGSYWPVVLILIGLGKYVSDSRSSGLLWMILGVLFLLITLNVVEGDFWTTFWSLVLVWLGANLLLRSLGREPVASEAGELVNATGIFSGSDKKVTSESFKGGNLTSIFGGTKLDLRKAKIAEKGAVIDVMVLFGGAEIVVPKDVPVKLDVFALFGGSEDKRGEMETGEKQPTLTVRGITLFGGTEVKD